MPVRRWNVAPVVPTRAGLEADRWHHACRHWYAWVVAVPHGRGDLASSGAARKSEVILLRRAQRLRLEGRGHNDLGQDERYFAAIRAFCEEVVPHAAVGLS